MSIVPKETIEVIAQSIGITNLSPDLLPALASDVEYRVREIMQEAIKCMRHSKRTSLSVEDLDTALTLRNLEPVYGFASGDPLTFKRAAAHKDLFYIEQKDVDFKQVIESPLPKAPLETAVMTHWLAIEGVQPAIPENPPLTLTPPPDPRKSDYREDGVAIDIKLPVKHVLSRELQLYFEKITQLAVTRSNSKLFNQALISLATDSGLHPLLPYFTYFIADEVSRNLNNFALLFALMRLVWTLLQNSHIHIEPYLHQLMPSVVTCLVAKRLGSKLSDNHWELRNFTANLVALVCKRYGHVYHTLQPRLTRTLLHAFMDPTKAFPQHYGAIQGLAALGSSVVRLLILPNLEPYLRLLEPEMQLEKQKNEMKRHEAWRVYGALMCTSGLCIYERLKAFPVLLSRASGTVLKSNQRVVTTMSNKRKASTDNLMHQPPLKKLATDNSSSAMPMNSPSMELRGGTGGYVPALGATDVGSVSMPASLSNEKFPSTSGRREVVGGQGQKTSDVIGRTGKEDLDVLRYMPLLNNYFGESMLSFIPSPELSLFL